MFRKPAQLYFGFVSLFGWTLTEYHLEDPLDSKNFSDKNPGNLRSIAHAFLVKITSTNQGSQVSISF